MIIVTVALLGGVGLLVQHGRANAAPATHRCPSVSTLDVFKHGPALRILTSDVSCTEALAIVRAMVSGIGVTFSGNPENAGSFRWKLYGFPGWTCYGDGSGFPEGGAGGLCAKGAGPEWRLGERRAPSSGITQPDPLTGVDHAHHCPTVGGMGSELRAVQVACARPGGRRPGASANGRDA